MKSLAQITEALIQDAIESCKQRNYLKRLVRQYFESLSAEERRVFYQELEKDAL